MSRTFDDDDRAIKRLWCAVIIQACMDEQNQVCSTLSPDDKRKAQLWLKGESRDFFEVCDLAGIPPQYLHRKDSSQQIISRKDMYRRAENRLIKKH